MTTKAHFFLDPRRGGSYADRVRSAFGSSLLAHWWLGESSGVTLAALNNSAYNGTYSGMTLAAIASPHGALATQADAINDVGILSAAALTTALANNGEGTLVAFARVRAASVWTDATARRFVVLSDAGNTNLINLQKNTTSNQLRVSRTAAGSTVAVAAIPSLTPGTTDWFCLAMTWSTSNNRLRAYYSAPGETPVQLGTTQTGVTAWSGVTLDTNQCSIAALNNSTLTQLWDGYECDVILGTSEIDFTTQLSPLMVL